MQQGRHVARSIRRGDARRRSATATRASSRRSAASRAVGVVKGLRVSGFLAWALWLGIHIVYLIGFQNRLSS